MLKAKIKQIFSTRAYVICCNDAVKAVVIGKEEDAQKKCEEMKVAYMKKHYYYLRDKELKIQSDIFFYHVHIAELFYIS